MRVAPHARVDDGLFDVLGLQGGPFAALRTAVRLYGGRYLPSPHVAVGRAAHVAVTTAIPCLVEADGDLVGTTPATFTVLPGRLRVLLPPGQGRPPGRSTAEDGWRPSPGPGGEEVDQLPGDPPAAGPPAVTTGRGIGLDDPVGRERLERGACGALGDAQGRGDCRRGQDRVLREQVEDAEGRGIRAEPGEVSAPPVLEGR